jgi:hypothetical protein
MGLGFAALYKRQDPAWMAMAIGFTGHLGIFMLEFLTDEKRLRLARIRELLEARYPAVIPVDRQDFALKTFSARRVILMATVAVFATFCFVSSGFFLVGLLMPKAPPAPIIENPERQPNPPGKDVP